jgi:hypothetical protein
MPSWITCAPSPSDLESLILVQQVARLSSAVLCQTKGSGRSFQPPIHVRIEATSPRTDRCVPRSSVIDRGLPRSRLVLEGIRVVLGEPSSPLAHRPRMHPSRAVMSIMASPSAAANTVRQRNARVCALLDVESNARAPPAPRASARPLSSTQRCFHRRR